MVGPLSKILPTILNCFVKPSQLAGVVREVCTTMDTLGADVENDDGYRYVPFLVLKAAGPSFQLPGADDKDEQGESDEQPSDIGFCNIPTCFLAKAEPKPGKGDTEMEILEELASYSRCVQSCFCGLVSSTDLDKGGYFEGNPTACMSGRSPLRRTSFVSCISTVLESRLPLQSTYTVIPRHLFGWSLAYLQQTRKHSASTLACFRPSPTD